ncbi:MAG TPA: DNRLRE domain-containing protein, partial [Planctomycetota bacterium]|nr:DNRLRE domain-containing protein [Planctomycetota bacterium]
MRPVDSPDCASIRARLAGFLYDDLPSADKGRVAAHLDACPDCRNALASMRQAAAALDAWVLDAPRPSALPARAERPPRRRYVARTIRVAPLAWGAAAVLLLAFSVHVASRRRAPEGAPSMGRKDVPQARPSRPDLAARERERREAVEEIARLEEERRRARERLEQIEREWEELFEERKRKTEEARRQDLARVEAERRKVEADLDRTHQARREAEEKLTRAETPGTVTVVAQIEWVQGEVHLLTPTGRVPAKTAKALVSGHGLETGEGNAAAVVRFPDSTRLVLGAAASVRALSETADGKRIDLVRGILEADVSRQPPGRPLVVRTHDAEARVLGTRLKLACGEATRLEVREGRVRLTRTQDGASVEVAGGHAATTRERRLSAVPFRETAFQDGVAPVPGYAGTRDTFLSESSPEHPYGARSPIQVDGDNPSGSGRELRMLLRWDIAAIPPGSRVESAVVVLHAADRTDPPFEIHAMTRPWSEVEATWNSAAADRDAKVLGTALPVGPFEYAFPLNADGVARVQSWVDSPGSNFGFMVVAADNTTGMKAHSRESSDPLRRPRLVVTYAPRR